MARPRGERRVRDMTKPQPAFPAHHPFAEPNKWELMLMGLAKGMSVSKACVYGSVHPSDAYKRRREDPQFAEMWKLAVEAGTDVLEDEAFERATKGKSDAVLMFMLKARRQMYRDKAPGEVNVQVDNRSIEVVAKVQPLLEYNPESLAFPMRALQHALESAGVPVPQAVIDGAKAEENGGSAS